MINNASVNLVCITNILIASRKYFIICKYLYEFTLQNGVTDRFLEKYRNYGIQVKFLQCLK